MKKINFPFLLLLVVMLFGSCQKEEVSVVDVPEISESIVATSSFNGGASCIHEIPDFHLDVEERDKIQIIYDEMVKIRPSYSEYGSLVKEGVLTVFKNDALDESLNLIPLINENQNEVKSLLFYAIEGSEITFFFIDKEKLSVYNKQGFSFERDGIEKVIESDELFKLFELCNYYLYCSQNEAGLRDDEVVVVKPSLWERFWNYLAKPKRDFTSRWGAEPFMLGDIGSFDLGNMSFGNGSGTIANNPEHIITNMLSLCEQVNGQTGDEVEGYINPEDPDIKLILGKCGIINTMGDLLTVGQYIALFNNAYLFNQVKDFIFGSSTNAEALERAANYIIMSLNNDINMPFKKFDLNYHLIFKVLKPTLDLENSELAFLMNNLNEPHNVSRQINDFLNNHPNEPDAIEHAQDHLKDLMESSEYKEYVESTQFWSAAMWAIAKEIIGDKVVDIIFRFIPGFGQADDVKDAIKAASHGDWMEFSYEVAKILVNNIPVKKLFKAWEALDELRDYISKIRKIWDKIGNLSETAIERLWDVARKSSIRLNTTYLKYVDDLEFPSLGFISNAPSYNEPWYIQSGFYRNQVFRGSFPDIPQAKFDNLEVHHAFPRAAATTRYPNLGITPGQLHSLKNLRGIGKDVYHPIQTNMKLHPYITGQWTQFYNANPNATYQQILDKIKEIDDEYGHLFTPPVR